MKTMTTPMPTTARRARYSQPAYVVALLAALYLAHCGSRESPELREADLGYYVRTLSADDFGGRESGTRFAVRAADFLVERYRAAGLTPAFGKSYVQKFPFSAGVAIGPANHFSLNTARGHRLTEVAGTPVPLAQPGEVEGDLVFLGFCLQAPGYDDLAGQNLKDKIALCLRHGPGGADNPAYARHIAFRKKFETLRAAGAAGILFVGRPGSPPLRSEDFPASYRSGPRALFVEADAVGKALPFLLSEDRKLLAGEIRKSEYAGQILGRIKLRTDFGEKNAGGQNVGAYLRPLAPEQKIVIVGAHYDHLGRGYFSSLRGSGQIHNGADDNASGTAVVLELAQALRAADTAATSAPGTEVAQNSALTRKLPAGVNVLFLHFDAEERGLFGSRAFVESAEFPAERTLAMLNLDMVGRLRAQKGLSLQGHQSADPRWKTLIEESFAAGGFPKDVPLRLVDGGSGPSDHASFYPRKVPVAFFFTGGHREYHTPDDDAPLINTAGLVAITRMSAALIEKTAALSPPPAYRRAPAEPSRMAFEFSVRLGIMPGDYEHGTKGLTVGDVREDAPVKKTGLRAGDVIIQLGTQKIENIDDYMQFLGDATADRSYKIVFRRGTQVITAETKLMAGD